MSKTITITAVLTEEQIAILAEMKKYPLNVPTTVHHDATIAEGVGPDGNPFSYPVEAWDEIVFVPNTMPKEEYIRKVYEGIILNDATTEYIKYSNLQKEEARIAEENAIREAVASSITSTVGGA